MIEAMTQHTNRGDLVFHRCLVRDRIDAKGETADDEQVGPGELLHELRGYLSAVEGWCPGAGDGDDLCCVEIGNAPVKQQRRSVGEWKQAIGVIRFRVE